MRRTYKILTFSLFSDQMSKRLKLLPEKVTETALNKSNSPFIIRYGHFPVVQILIFKIDVFLSD